MHKNLMHLDDHYIFTNVLCKKASISKSMLNTFALKPVASLIELVNVIVHSNSQQAHSAHKVKLSSRASRTLLHPQKHTQRCNAISIIHTLACLTRLTNHLSSSCSCMIFASKLHSTNLSKILL